MLLCKRLNSLVPFGAVVTHVRWATTATTAPRKKKPSRRKTSPASTRSTGARATSSSTTRVHPDITAQTAEVSRATASNPSRPQKSRLAATTAAAPKGKQSTAASVSSSSSSLSPAEPLSDRVDPAAAATARKQMEEADVRLTMRLLMSRHLSREQAMRKPEEVKREEERERLRKRLEKRMQRIEEKNKNSARLLAAGDAAAVGDGILPFFANTTQNPFDSFSTRSEGSAGSKDRTANWMRPNPVGLSEEGEEQVNDGSNTDLMWNAEDNSPLTSRNGGEGRPLSLMTLTQPDLSVYDSEHDYRIRSEDVVRASSTAGKDAPRGSLSSKTLSDMDQYGEAMGFTEDVFAAAVGPQGTAEWAAAEVLPRDGRAATSLLRRGMLPQEDHDDEDADFSVRAYEGNHHDDTDL